VQHTKAEKYIPSDQIYTKWELHIYRMAIKWTKWPYSIPTSSIARPVKINPNWYVWFENIPSGNPALEMV
jgi:hypothetical protein